MKKSELRVLLKHEEVIRRINENPYQADQLIEEMCLESPDEAYSIRMAGELVKHYRTEYSPLSADKAAMMWSNVLKKSESRKQTRLFHLPHFLRIAASVAILVVMAFFLYQYTRDNSLRQFAKNHVDGEARIIISDGSEYVLKSNNSHIKYDTNGAEIIIEDKNNQTKKLSNRPTKEETILNQIIVPYGTRYRLTLSDGTLVQLNSGSKLVFPAKFNGAKREVFLQGEGFFDVAKDAKKAFVVCTDRIDVKVFGTQFNISAYENEKSASAVLVEGSVEVTRSGSIFNRGHIRIKPGEGCFFDEGSKELVIKKVEVIEYISWKDGYFLLHDQSLAEIVHKIHKYYNKVITIEDQELANRIISGKLILSSKPEGTIDFLARTTKSRYILQEDGSCKFYK